MKRFLRAVFIFLTVSLTIVYGLACLTPLISPNRWAVSGFLGLAFPVLLLLLLLSVSIWFFIRKKTALLLLLLASCGAYHIIHLFGFRAGKFTVAKAPGTVRIMGWNVQGFTTQEHYRDSFNSVRHRLFRYISRQQPDIICLQDYTEYHHPRIASNIQMLADTLHYPYYITSNDYIEYPPWGPVYSGIAIFSKYPLLNARRIRFTGKKIPESILIADVTINGTTKRLVVTHLQSMHLRYSKTAADAWQVADEDSTLNQLGTPYKKLSYYFPYHARQAMQVRKVIDESPWPVIFSADMNEVPTSWCYHHIKGNLQDAFLKKGSGLGRTYTAISPTLRIDYLMASAGTPITQYLKDTVHLSDHYPQLMDVKW